MASQIGGLFFSLSVDATGLASGVSRSARTTERGMQRITRSAGIAETQVRRTNRAVAQPLRPFSLIAASRAFDTTSARAQLLRGSMIALTGAFGGFSAALGANVVLRYADSFTSLKNQIRVVAKDAGELSAQFEAVENISIRSRAGLRETAILYSRLAKAAPLRAPQELLAFTETIQKSLQLGGATAQEAASAAIQFSQAIASNRLGGEELRAVLETPLGLQLAKGLGVSIGRFRELGKAGELTADALFGSLEKISGGINQEFNQSIRTFDQAVTIADTNLTSYVGKLNESFGATQILGNGIVNLTSDLETLAPVLGTVVGALGAAFGGRLLSTPFTRGASAVATVKDRAADQVKLATQLVARRKSESARAKAELAKLKRLEGTPDARQFADLSLNKAAQRASAQAQTKLPQLDQRSLGLLDKELQLRSELASTTLQSTPRLVKASESLATAQTKLNGLVAQERLLRGQVGAARTLAAAQATTGPGTAAANQALRTQQRLERDLVRVQNSRAAQEVTLSARRKTLFENETAAFQKSVEQRARILSRINDTVATRARVNASRDELNVSSRQAGAAAQTSGRANLAREVTQANRNVVFGRLQGQQAQRSLANATRAARPLSIALRGVQSAGLGLVGFLGGPWGVAFTGAIALLTVLGIQSARTAKQLEDGNARIAKSLKGIRDASGGDAGDAETSLDLRTNTKAQEEAAQGVSDVTAVLNKNVREARSLFQLAPPPVGNEIRRSAREASEELERLIKDAVNGTVTIKDLRDGVNNLANEFGIVDEGSKKFRTGLVDQAIAARDATRTLRALSAEQKTLADQRDVLIERSSGPQGEVTTGSILSGEATRAVSNASNELQGVQKQVQAQIKRLTTVLGKDQIKVAGLVQDQVEAASRVNVALRRGAALIRSSASELSGVQSDISDFSRSLGQQQAARAGRAGGLALQASEVRKIRDELTNAKQTLEDFGTVNLGILPAASGLDDAQNQAAIFNSVIGSLDDVGTRFQRGDLLATNFAQSVGDIADRLRDVGVGDSAISRLITDFITLTSQVGILDEKLRTSQGRLQSFGLGNSLTAQITSNVPSAQGGSGLSPGALSAGVDKGVSRGFQRLTTSVDRGNRELTRETRAVQSEIRIASAKELAALPPRADGVRGGGSDVRTVQPVVIRGNVIVDDPIAQGTQGEINQALDNLNDTERQSLQETRGIRNALQSQLSVFESGFKSLRTTEGNLSDTFTGQFEFQDAETQAFQNRVSELERERNVLQSGLGVRDLSDTQEEQVELRIAEINQTIARLADAFAKLPDSRTFTSFGGVGAAGSTGGLTITERRPLSTSGDFRNLLGSRLTGFASGGTFDIAGRGGTDNNLVQFMGSQGETGIVLRNGEHQKLLNALGAGTSSGGGNTEIGKVEVIFPGVQDLDGVAQAREQIAVEFAGSVQQAMETR